MMGRGFATGWLMANLGIYFAVLAAIRVALGAPLTLEESGMLDASLNLAHNPAPLHPALLAALVTATGDGLMAVAILSSILLFALAVAVFALVRVVLPAPVAAFATIFLVLLPEIFWNARFEDGPALLAAVMMGMLALSAATIEERPGLIGYAAFGCYLGLGALSHQSFLPAAAALILAMLASPEYRARILSWKIGAAFGIAGLVAFGPVAMADLALPQIPQPRLVDPATALERTGAAFGVLRGIIVFLGLLMVLSWWSIYRGLNSAAPLPGLDSLRRLLARTVAIWCLLAIAAALTGGPAELDPAGARAGLFLAAPAAALYLYPVIGRDTRNMVNMGATALAVVTLLLTPFYLSYGPQQTALEASRYASR